MDEKQLVIQLQLSVEEANIILRTLAKQPFEEVAGLINKIKTTGEEQVAKQVASAEAAESAPTPSDQ